MKNMFRMLEGLKECFIFSREEDFTKWLLRSNNPKVVPYLGEERFTNMRIHVEGESLQEILDILLREPLADYFWYGYGGKLSYSLPHHDTVPGDVRYSRIRPLRVDVERIKVFLRDIKIESILQ